MIKRRGRITHQGRTNCIRSKHGANMWSIASVFPSVAEDNTEYCIESYLALKIIFIWQSSNRLYIYTYDYTFRFI